MNNKNSILGLTSIMLSTKLLRTCTNESIKHKIDLIERTVEDIALREGVLDEVKAEFKQALALEKMIGIEDDG